MASPRHRRANWIRQHSVAASVAFGAATTVLILVLYGLVSLVWDADSWMVPVGIAIGPGVVGGLRFRAAAAG